MDRAVPKIVINIRNVGAGVSLTALESYYAKQVHTSKSSGHSVGLLLARELTEGMGGYLAILSDKSRTTVLIHLPNFEMARWYF
jgi:sensor histidine kinase regulating citrate/malate metabolism